MITDTYQAQPGFVIVTQTKSVGIAILLTLLFGPIGLFYATVRGALTVLFLLPTAFVVLAALVAASPSAGGAFWALMLIPLGFATTWIVSLIWCVTAVNAYNRQLGAPRV
jgi:hypothetical protein